MMFNKKRIRGERDLLFAKWHRINALPKWLRQEGFDVRTIHALEDALETINQTATPEQGRRYRQEKTDE